MTRARRGAAALLLAALPALALALETPLGRPAVVEAVRLARALDPAALDRFHAEYRHPLGGPFFESVGLVTEFRRAVQLAERAQRLRGGASVEAIEEALEPFRGVITVEATVRFDPRNTYRALPRLEAVVYRPDGATIVPLDQRSAPSYLRGPAPPGTPILEGRLEADFPAAAFDAGGTCLVGLFLEGREVRRVPVDFDRIR